jgi:molybdopterin biosynthesis enzyme
VPVLGRSNLIYTLVNAEGVFQISLDSTGIQAGEWVTVALYGALYGGRGGAPGR